MEVEEIIREVHKIHAIADLLVSHNEEEFAYLGVLISDITHPLLEKLRESKTTVRSFE